MTKPTPTKPRHDSKNSHGVGTNFPATSVPTTAKDDSSPGPNLHANDTHASNMSTGVEANLGPFLDDWVLSMFAETLDDLERVRCANENRLRALTTEHGLTERHKDIARLANMVTKLAEFEHQAVLDLNRQVRKHPLWQIFKDQRGVGEKQFARLLAVIHDPAWHDQLDQPRTCRQLRAYCGIHVLETPGTKSRNESKVNPGVGTSHPDDKRRDDSKNTYVVGVAPKHQRGHKSNWNDDARKRLWLIADSIIRNNMGKMADRPGRSKYAEIYEKSRTAQYGDATHDLPCIRCGPKGSPAPAGAPLSDGHKKARAMRKMMSEILNDLWREAYRLHQ